MAQHVSAPITGTKMKFQQRPTNQIADTAGTSKSFQGSSALNKQTPGGTNWSGVFQIVRHSLSDFLQQWQAVHASAFATYEQLTVAPVNVVQGQLDHFVGTQPQPGQQQEYRIISFTNLAAPVTRSQHHLHLARLLVFCHSRPTLS